uniref:Transcription factor bHLH94-like n=1 Tax=Tanacetum cinerariifolium TaxID=118510 RepID=A0A6L2KAW2_TANCI|nr:transcription factor bHLH94-like [Tanacetum cinerariifolium]
MALETIIYPKGEIGSLGYDYFMQEEHAFDEFLECANNSNINHYQDQSSNNVHAYWGDYYSSPENCIGAHDMKLELSSPTAVVAATTAVGARKKRRRTKSGKNKQELENQRMTHITVERNRRKQMNEYLAVIRGLMPSSYAQRGDQASIVGGAINFVKELEQQLQTLEAQKRANNNSVTFSPSSQPFSDFFSFPQYSIRPDANDGSSSSSTTKNRLAAMAEIEVTMVESHANIKILSKKRQRQLLKMVAGLQCLWITILHLNVSTTLEQMVLYTLSVKLEDGCQLTTT